MTAQDLLKLLPEFFVKIKEYPEIMQAYTAALDDMEINIGQVRDNMFIQTCDASTIALYEQLFGITPQPGDTLEARRNRVLNRLSMVVPFTERYLRSRLDEMYGAGNYTLTIDSTTSTAVMEIHDFISQGIELFCDLWYRVAPAHVALDAHEDIVTEIDHPMYFGGICQQTLIETF